MGSGRGSFTERGRAVARELRSWTRDWGGRATLALIALAAAYLVWQVAGWGGPSRRTLISDVAFVPLGLAGAILSFRVARHPDLDARTRRAWFVVGAAMLAYWAGDVLWTWFENTQAEPPFPSVADAFYLLFYPALMAGLLMFPTVPRSKTDRTKFWLDAGTVLLGGWMIVWYFVLGPTAFTHGSGSVETMVSIAYPVGDLVLLFGVTAVILRRPMDGSRGALGILAGALVLFVVGDIAFGYLSLKGNYAGGDIPDSLYMLAQVLMVVAAHVQFRRAGSARSSAGSSASVSAKYSRLPYAAVAVSFGVLVVVAQHQAVYPIGGLLIGAVGVTALVVWRQIAALRENARLVDELHALAVTDVLTGLPNRRHFFDAAALEFHRAQRYGRPLAAIMLDVDHFKTINDGNGHALGDEVLKAVASAFRAGIRGVDLVARYGGDEFVAMLPESDAVAALAVAERLRALVRDICVGVDRVRVTLSIGVADAQDCADLNSLLARADQALYEAKRAGRDCARALHVA